MTKKSTEKLFESVSEGVPGRVLSKRVSPHTMQKIQDDFLDIATFVAETGAVRPSFEKMADFIWKNHKVRIAPSTASSYYRTALERVQNGKA